MNKNRPLILFDSNCELCKRFKQGIEHIDKEGKIFFHDVNDMDLYESLTFLNYEACKDKVHLINENDDVLVGAEVVDFLVKVLPGVSKFAWLLDYDMGKKAVSVFYDTVDKIRQSRLLCDKCKR